MSKFLPRTVYLRRADFRLWLAPLLTAGLLKLGAATLSVVNANDSGSGSLRQALLNANTTNGLDTVVFNIPGAGVHTISPVSALPSITDAIVIDGTTQPGYAGKPLIELNGASAGATNSGLRLLVGNSVIRGLTINRFGGNGIDIEGAGGNSIQGNFIGTDTNGAVTRPNGQAGVLIYNSANNLIGSTNASLRNVISGNSGGSGVFIYGTASSANSIQGNYIGTDASGSVAIANAGDGVTLQAASANVVGGTNSGAGNVISGNSQVGIYIEGPGASGNLIQGNRIGTTGSGTAALGNAFAGITLSQATSNSIGGQIAAARNVISGNKQDGIFLSSNSSWNSIVGNYIGLNAAGAAALSNGFNGVSLNSACSNVIGGVLAASGNVISGSGFYGVELFAGAASNSILGNFIGTDWSGFSSVSNRLSGVRIESPSNTIGGGAAGAGNLISGNGQDGVYIYSNRATNNFIQGNLIGTAANGSSRLGNGRAGIGIDAAANNVIGGSNPGEGNIISANAYEGIYLLEPGTFGNRIQGNKIGTDISGGLALGNLSDGIYLNIASNNFIGGAIAGAGNQISGNAATGIWLLQAPRNSIQGNLIGTQSDGAGPLGNSSSGIDCDSGSTNTTIGGSLGAGNTVAFSAAPYSGVRIRTGTLNNCILYNCIFSNGALGIDLGPAGVSLNDGCDADTGANNLQNFPVLSQAVSGNGTGVRGTLNSMPGNTFRLQFFANPVCNASGNGEGMIYLGDATVVTAANCNASFVTNFPVNLPTTYFITATATDGTNNTSEFSACAAIAPVPELYVSVTNQQANLSWTNTATGFVLKQTTNLIPPIIWTTVTNSPTVIAGQSVVSLPITSANRFFLLSFE